MRATALLLAIATFGCGNDDTGQGADAAATADADPSTPDARIGPDGQPVSLSNQIIANDCAPNDGPALRILLTDDTIGAECRGPGLGESVEIFIYTNNISPPQTITFSDTDFSANATHCLGGAAPCLTSQAGEIRFETYEAGTGASGTFRIEFGGNAIEGSFDASWCTPNTPLICG